MAYNKIVFPAARLPTARERKKWRRPPDRTDKTLTNPRLVTSDGAA
jgi:hypothetical protein